MFKTLYVLNLRKTLKNQKTIASGENDIMTFFKTLNVNKKISMANVFEILNLNIKFHIQTYKL